MTLSFDKGGASRASWFSMINWKFAHNKVCKLTKLINPNFSDLFNFFFFKIDPNYQFVIEKHEINYSFNGSAFDQSDCLNQRQFETFTLYWL